MKAVATWQGGYRTLLEDGRGHAVTVDLPADEDGEDVGTSALELAVLSLAGCISTIFAVVAERRRLRYDALRIELEAIRPHGARTFTSVHGTCTVGTDAPPDEVGTALRLTVRTCPVGVLLDRAQVPVELHTVVVPAAAPSRVP